MLESGDVYTSTFWVCALGGTAFFVVRIVLMLVLGLDHGSDVDGHHGAHAGTDGSDFSFKLLSLHSLTGFFMIFGWIGLACYEQFGLGPLLSVFIALVSGFLMMVLTAALFRAAMALASPGSQFRIEDAVGLIGSVYNRIPANGRGRIQVRVSGSTRELDAVSEALVDIDSHRSVEVVRTVDDRTVSVKLVN